MPTCLRVAPGVSFKVAYLIWKVSYIDVVAACLECIIGELKLSVDVFPLTLKLMTLVINAAVAFDLCNEVPAVLICDCLVKGVKCRTRTCEQVVEPWWHRVGWI